MKVCLLKPLHVSKPNKTSWSINFVFFSPFSSESLFVQSTVPAAVSFHNFPHLYDDKFLFENCVFEMMDRHSFMRVCTHPSFYFTKYSSCLILIYSWDGFLCNPHTFHSPPRFSCFFPCTKFPQLLSHLSRLLTEVSQRERSAWHPDKSAAQKATARSAAKAIRNSAPCRRLPFLLPPFSFLLSPLFFCGLLRLLF